VELGAAGGGAATATVVGAAAWVVCVGAATLAGEACEASSGGPGEIGGGGSA
jgi:hypothetical protein